MPPSESDVEQDVLDELGQSLENYSVFNFIDQPTFEAYLDRIITRIETDHAARVGQDWSLDKEKYLLAVIYEACAKLVRRVANQYFTQQLQSEAIEIGPIKIQSARNSEVAKQVVQAAEQYHQLAEVLLGTSGRKAALRVWTPRQRIRMI